MSIQSHINELHKKHTKLKQTIESELKHPGADELQIHAMKKQKLRLKDEINKLENQ